MIYLQFPEANNQTQAWQERLDKLIVAFKSEENAGLSEPILKENNQLYHGVPAIESFLKNLEDEVADWRTHRCGV